MRWTILLLGFAIGVLSLAAFRFATVQPPEAVHHHANFAVFIDGERLDLSGDRYMEDVASCAADPNAVRPEDRIHLHDNNHDVVHVHHAGATWGHLMANLGFSLGEDHLIADDGRRFFDGEEGRSMVQVLNGMPVPSAHNRAVRSGDRLVISVGTEDPDEVLGRLYPRVAANAAEYNQRADPAGCAGAHGPLTFSQRLRMAFLGA